MNENQSPSAPQRFPAPFLTVAMLLTATVLGWFGWSTYTNYRVTRLIGDRYFRIQELQGVITHLDEVLTMSARMASTTGDQAWERRYLRFEPMLDEAIKEVIRLAPNAYSGAGASETDAANLKLVEMEHRAFDLVRQERQAEARQVLFSEEYEAQKRIYSQGMLKVVASLKQEASDTLESEQRKAFLNSLGVIVALPILLIGWLVALRNVNRWRFQLTESNRRLDQQASVLLELNTSLDKRVEERTAELQQRERTITRLSEMADLLQTCHGPEEAYAILGRSLVQLFPAMGGAIYMISPSRGLLEAVVVWGGSNLAGSVFSPPDCWALRRGRLHLYEHNGPAPECAHRSHTADYLCIPMLAQGEAMGVLHLESVPGPEPGGEGSASPLTPSCQSLATAVAEQIALAVANLQLRESLRNQSIRDPLTNLFNRRYMEESLERELRRAARSKTPLGLIMLDVDHFKRFNDTCGHDAGDEMLRLVARLLQTGIRAEDIACRYGGEEFVVILPNSTLEGATRRAEQLRQRARQIRLKLHGQPDAEVSLSLGVAAFPTHGSTAETLLRVADQALYRAKHEGRDRVAIGELAE